MSELNKEVLDSLKSKLTDDAKVFSGHQEAGRAAFVELEEARKSKDETIIKEASDKFEAVGNTIRDARKSIQEVEDQITLFTEYNVADEKTAGRMSREELKSVLEEFEAKSIDVAEKSVGEIFADILTSTGRTSYDSLYRDGNSVSLTAIIGKNDRQAFEDAKLVKNAKSLYTNHGSVLVVSSANVPGHVGYQCGLVEDPYICPLTLPPDEFEDCLTVKTMPRGNRLRYTRMTSRTDNAGVVRESVYNPYPTLVQDGTKPEGTFTLASVEVNDTKIAEFVTVSDEVLEDCPSVASLINDFLITGVEQKKRQQLISGTGSNTQMTGLLNQPDILTRIHRSTPNGVAGDNIYDTFRRAMTDLWIQGADTSNLCVIMNVTDGEIIDLLKDDIGRYLFNENSADCINRKLKCLNIKYASSIPAGTAVIGALQNNWTMYVRKALDIRMGYTGDQFITNTNTILAEMRALAMVRCPQHIERITGIAL